MLDYRSGIPFIIFFITSLFIALTFYSSPEPLQAVLHLCHEGAFELVLTYHEIHTGKSATEPLGRWHFPHVRLMDAELGWSYLLTMAGLTVHSAPFCVGDLEPQNHFIPP